MIKKIVEQVPCLFKTVLNYDAYPKSQMVYEFNLLEKKVKKDCYLQVDGVPDLEGSLDGAHVEDEAAADLNVAHLQLDRLVVGLDQESFVISLQWKRIILKNLFIFQCL